MKMPEFTAEASLYETSGHYHSICTPNAPSNDGGILPMLSWRKRNYCCRLIDNTAYPPEVVRCIDHRSYPAVADMRCTGYALDYGTDAQNSRGRCEEFDSCFGVPGGW